MKLRLPVGMSLQSAVAAAVSGTATYKKVDDAAPSLAPVGNRRDRRKREAFTRKLSKRLKAAGIQLESTVDGKKKS